jgi:hypothetical protein
MALNVTVDLPQYEGMGPIGIVGVGVVENGESIDLDEGQEAAFYIINGYPLQDAGQEGVDVSGSPDFIPPDPVPEVQVEAEQETQPTAETTGLPTGLPQSNEGGEA